MTARPFCRRVDPRSGGPSGSFAGARGWIAGLAGRCSEPPGRGPAPRGLARALTGRLRDLFRAPDVRPIRSARVCRTCVRGRHQRLGLTGALHAYPLAHASVQGALSGACAWTWTCLRLCPWGFKCLASWLVDLPTGAQTCRWRQGQLSASIGAGRDPAADLSSVLKAHSHPNPEDRRVACEESCVWSAVSEPRRLSVARAGGRGFALGA